MHYAVFDTLWGAFGFVEHNRRLIATFLPRARREMVRTIRSSFSDATEAPDALPRFRQAVVAYFEGKRTRFPIEIDLRRVPPFHQTVLAACRRIPYGQTASYADLARAVGKPNAARAVGGAMARNPLPLVIPCHRVLRTGGSIGGFSSTDGVDEKARLLRLENATIGRHGEAAAIRATTGLAFARSKGVSGKRRPAVVVSVR
jgi:methylated-DNA-[protein]-cysteine S-methyltransferase